MKSVFVKHAYGDVYDAFWDSGWTHWTRFLFRKNEVTYIKGRTITTGDKALLKQAIPQDHEVHAS